MSRSDTDRPAHPYRVSVASPDKFAGMTEMAAFDHASKLFESLEERKQAMSDETWGLFDQMQRRYDYSYGELAQWLGWSFEGIRKRMTDYRLRHHIDYVPRRNQNRRPPPHQREGQQVNPA